MKKIITLLLLCASIGLYAQKDGLVEFDELDKEIAFESMEDALAEPENVIKLDLSKQKLANLDYDFRKLVNLQWLDLSKNELNSFPLAITELPKLQYVDLSKNNIDKIPDEIGKLEHLRHLAISKNRIYVISPEMGKCRNMEYFDLWDNPVKSFPEELRHMSKLKRLDLRVTVINEAEQKKLMKMFPDTDIKFSKTCNCN